MKHASLSELRDCLTGTASDAERQRVADDLEDPNSFLRAYCSHLAEMPPHNPADVDWWEVLADFVDEDLSDSLGDQSVAPRVADDTPQSRLTHARPTKYVARTAVAGLALAACLLLGLFLGRWLADGPTIDGFEVLVASAEPVVVPAAGAEEPVAIQIESPMDGYASIVLVLPDDSIDVLPVLGGKDIAVSADTQVQSPAIPAHIADATAALIVITSTPADDTIRKYFLDDNAITSDLNQLQKQVERLLQQSGHRMIAFASVDFQSRSAAPN